MMHPETGDAWRSPLAGSFGARTRERVPDLWVDRDGLPATIDALPHVFGHGDLHPRNALLGVGVDQIVAVDWAFAAALRSAPTWLIWSAWRHGSATSRSPSSPSSSRSRSPPTRTANGRPAGTATPQLARWATRRRVALGTLGACMPGWAASTLGPGASALLRTALHLHSAPSRPSSATWIALEDICLDLADEARELAAQLGLASRSKRGTDAVASASRARGTEPGPQGGVRLSATGRGRWACH